MTNEEVVRMIAEMRAEFTAQTIEIRAAMTSVRDGNGRALEALRDHVREDTTRLHLRLDKMDEHWDVDLAQVNRSIVDVAAELKGIGELHGQVRVLKEDFTEFRGHVVKGVILLALAGVTSLAGWAFKKLVNLGG